MANELDTISIYQLRPSDNGSVSAVGAANTGALGGGDRRPQPVFQSAQAGQRQPETPSKAIDEAELARTVELLNQAMERFNHTVEFQHDKSTDMTVV